MKRVIHFQPGDYPSRHPACSSVIFASYLSEIPSRVTCGNCRRTKEFNRAQERFATQIPPDWIASYVTGEPIRAPWMRDKELFVPKLIHIGHSAKGKADIFLF